MTHENWPEEWRSDLVTWTPKRNAEFSIAGIEFKVNQGEEVTTPSIVKATFDEAWPDFKSEGELVAGDEPAQEAEAEGDGSEQENGIGGDPDSGAIGPAGSAGEPGGDGTDGDIAGGVAF